MVISSARVMEASPVFKMLVTRGLSSIRCVNYHAPGLFAVKNSLTNEEQKTVSNCIYKLGVGKGGFSYTTKQRHRGRMFMPIVDLPSAVTDIFYHQIESFVGIDNTLDIKQPTHAIILYYKPTQLPQDKPYMPWHCDNGDNDGLGDYPIFSFSVGDACQFLVANEKPRISDTHGFDNPTNLAHNIRLDSGDALIFGDPSRYIWHAIYQQHLDTAPSIFPFMAGRLNITLRHTPHVYGEENAFEDIPEEICANNKFFRLS